MACEGAWGAPEANRAFLCHASCVGHDSHEDAYSCVAAEEARSIRKAPRAARAGLGPKWRPDQVMGDQTPGKGRRRLCGVYPVKQDFFFQYKN